MQYIFLKLFNALNKYLWNYLFNHVFNVYIILQFTKHSRCFILGPKSVYPNLASL